MPTTDDRGERRVRRASSATVEVDDAVGRGRAEETGGYHSDEREYDDSRGRDAGWLVVGVRVARVPVDRRVKRFHAIDRRQRTTTLSSAPMRTLVVLPTYNESENIETVLRPRPNDRPRR